MSESSNGSIFQRNNVVAPLALVRAVLSKMWSHSAFNRKKQSMAEAEAHPRVMQPVGGGVGMSHSSSRSGVECIDSVQMHNLRRMRALPEMKRLHSTLSC